jgi:hypothetical protein
MRHPASGKRSAPPAPGGSFHASHVAELLPRTATPPPICCQSCPPADSAGPSMNAADSPRLNDSDAVSRMVASMTSVSVACPVPSPAAVLPGSVIRNAPSPVAE